MCHCTLNTQTTLRARATPLDNWLNKLALGIWNKEEIEETGTQTRKIIVWWRHSCNPPPPTSKPHLSRVWRELQERKEQNLPLSIMPATLLRDRINKISKSLQDRRAFQWPGGNFPPSLLKSLRHKADSCVEKWMTEGARLESRSTTVCWVLLASEYSQKKPSQWRASREEEKLTSSFCGWLRQRFSGFCGTVGGGVMAHFRGEGGQEQEVRDLTPETFSAL